MMSAFLSMDTTMNQDRAAFACFAFLGAALLFWTYRYGPTWPWDDGYGYLRYIDALRSGGLRWYNIIVARSNEHLIAFHLSTALAILKLSGVNMKALIYANAVLVVVAGVFLWLALRRSELARTSGVLLAVAVTFPLLNPSQTSYLLWEFQIWWYLDLAMFAAAIFLVERYQLRAYPIIFLLCLLATGSEAQGSFLWLSTGAHLFLVSSRSDNRKSRIGGRLALCAHSILFLVAAWITMQGGNNNIGHVKTSISVFSHISYFTKMIGGGFGVRDENFALAMGAICLALFAVFVVRSAGRLFASTEERVALILTGTPLLWTAAFSVGRESLGVAWAFGDFHEAPMLVPFFVGIAIFALHGLRGKLAAAVAIAAVAMPLITGAAWGHERSVQMRLTSNRAAAANCAGIDVSRKDMLRLIGLETFGYVYDSTMHFVPKMCKHQGDVSGWVPDLKRDIANASGAI